MATERIQIIVTERGTRQVKAGLEGVGASAKRAEGGVSLLHKALGTLALGVATRNIIRTADEFTNLQNRIRLVTRDTAELNAVTQELIGIASRTRGDLVNTGAAYFKVARQAEVLGLSQAEVLGFTESLNQAIVLSGASAVEASSGILQLGQGLASGALRGDELRSVLENLPEVAQTISDGLGVTIGQLRVLGSEGKITADVVIDAFQKAEESLRERFGTTIPTVSQAVAVLTTSWVALVGEFSTSNAITATLAQGIIGLSEHLETLARVASVAAVTLGVTLAAQAIPAAISGITALTAAIAVNPFGALAIAITATTTALVVFGDEIVIAKDGVTNMQDFALAAWRRIGEGLDAMSRTATEAFGQVEDESTSASELVVEAWSQAPRIVARSFDFLLGLVRGTVLAVAETVEQMIRNVTTVGSRLVEFVTSGFDESVFRDQGLLLGTTFSESLQRGFLRGFSDQGSVLEDELDNLVGRAQLIANDRIEFQSARNAAGAAAQLGLLDDQLAQVVVNEEEVTKKFLEMVEAYEFAEAPMDALNERLRAMMELMDAPPPGFLDGYIAQLAMMQEETKGAASAVGAEFADIFGPGGTLAQGLGDIIAQTVVFGDRVDQLFKRLGQTIVSQVISSLVQLGVNMALNAALGNSLAASSAATSVAAASAVSAAWQPAATFVNAATFGAGATAGTASLASSLATIKGLGIAGGGLPGFATGGFTGPGSPGQPVGLVHPNEFVLNADATRRIGRGPLESMNAGRSGGSGPTLNVTAINNAPGVDIEVRQVTPTDVEIIANRVLASRGPTVIAQDLSNPGSKTRRAITTGTTTRNRRT